MQRKWLKIIREERVLTQKQVAEVISIAPSTYAMYEQGSRTPSVAVAARIGDYLQFDWQLFFENQLHDSCKKILKQLA